MYIKIAYRTQSFFSVEHSFAQINYHTIIFSAYRLNFMQHKHDSYPKQLSCNYHKLSFNYHFDPFHRKIRYPKALQNRLFCTEHTLFFSNTMSYLAENKQKSSPSLPSECHLHPRLNDAKTRVLKVSRPGSQ